MLIRIIVRFVFMMVLLSVNTVKAESIFAYGADIGWIKQLEDNGVSWVNDEGNTADPLVILKNHGVNSVRLRVFVDPDPSALWYKDSTTWTMLGYTDKQSVINAALRAQNLGMQIMIDFHYSDVFADPGHQEKPQSWNSYDFNTLKSAVYNHTYEVMSALVSAGVTPEWVQVGNEMNSGILLPTGSVNNFSNLTQLLNSGYDAVKAVSSTSKVVSHLAHGENNANSRWFFDNFLQTYGGKTDVLGFSFYPYWIGENYWDVTGDLEYNLNDMVSRYGKEVMVVEIGGLENAPTDTYWTIKDTINIVKNVANDKGTGVFYWEPAANSAVLPDGYPLGATTQISPSVLQFTTALDAFADAQIDLTPTTSYKITNRISSKSLNVVGGSTQDGAYIEQYSYSAWDSQKFNFSFVDSGYYTITNVKSGKLLTVESESVQSGAFISQETNNGSWSQQWQILEAGDGYYQLINRKSKKLLDMNQSSLSDGAQSIQWEDNGGWNQQWLIEVAN